MQRSTLRTRFSHSAARHPTWARPPPSNRASISPTHCPADTSMPPMVATSFEAALATDTLSLLSVVNACDRRAAAPRRAVHRHYDTVSCGKWTHTALRQPPPLPYLLLDSITNCGAHGQPCSAAFRLVRRVNVFRREEARHLPCHGVHSAVCQNLGKAGHEARLGHGTRHTAHMRTSRGLAAP